MPERNALSVAFDNSDRQFFITHGDRQARIRLPYKNECEGEFFSLGEHNRARRRILLWRVPRDNPHYHQLKQQVLKIAFLAFGEETIEDSDAVLLPLIHDIMLNAK